jgi:hypothetical protein
MHKNGSKIASMPKKSWQIKQWNSNNLVPINI